MTTLADRKDEFAALVVILDALKALPDDAQERIVKYLHTIRRTDAKSNAGYARAAALTPERRQEIAREAANKRWQK